VKTTSSGLVALLLFVPALSAEWKPHQVRRMAGRSEVKLPGKFQIVTESWNRVVAVPYIAYMPDKDRLAMLVSCDYPHHAMILTSNDRGSTWTLPRYVHTDRSGRPDTGMGTGLAYLGNGRLLLAAGDGTLGDWVWFSSDHGENWTERNSGTVYSFDRRLSTGRRTLRSLWSLPALSLP